MARRCSSAWALGYAGAVQARVFQRKELSDGRGLSGSHYVSIVLLDHAERGLGVDIILFSSQF